MFICLCLRLRTTMASTIRFNVGGREFEIYLSDCCKVPGLSTSITKDRRRDNIVFLNHNPDAFGVVVDFLRYDRILVPPSVCAKTVELIFDDLCIPLSGAQRRELGNAAKTKSATFEDGMYDEMPPQYSTMHLEKDAPLQMEKRNTGDSETSSLFDQLTITVQQKVTDIIHTIIRPRITSQALQGAFRTTCVLLPSTAKDGVMMSEFPHSNYTEIIYLDEELERFLTQPEVERRFEDELMDSFGVPIKTEKKDVFFRNENEFGIAQTTTTRALVIYFELGRLLV